MNKALFSFLGCVAGTVFAAYILPGVHTVELMTAMLPGAAIGVVYLVIRPVLKLVSAPFALLTLGLLWVMLDAGIFWVVTREFRGITVEHFGWAIAASVIINIARSLFRGLAR